MCIHSWNIKPDTPVILEIDMLGKCYFILCDGYIKVGRSNNPKERARNIQTGNPHDVKLLGYIENEKSYCKNVELDVQTTLTKHGYHIRGEWFKAESEVLEYIELLIGNGLGRRSYFRYKSLDHKFKIKMEKLSKCI